MGTIFGTKLKELRVENSLTQKSLAEKLSITVSTLSHWECNYQEPAFKDLILISNFFNVSVDYLLGLEDDFGIMKADNTNALPAYSKEEQQLIEDYRALNYSGKKLVKQTVETLRTTSAQSEQKKKV